MIEKVIYTVLIALAAFVGVGLSLPREVHVERSVEIQRPVGTLFTLLNRLDSFPEWSPWNERDPGAEFRFSGPDSGVGARMEWSGDPRQVGTGWLEITDSRPNSLVRARLMIDRQGEADTAFTIERIAGGARVTWAFDADLVDGHGWFGALVTRYFGLLFDRWVGGDFERGLEQLRQYAESLPASDFTGLNVELIDTAPVDILYMSSSGGGREALADAYRKISSFMAANGIGMAAQPLALTRVDADGMIRTEAAIPAHRSDTAGTDGVFWGTLPPGQAAVAVHRGAYEGVPATREKLAAWMAAHGYDAGGVSWEQYISDPAETPPGERVTHICVLLSDRD